MDHMRISGNEPSSVILSQTKWFQTLKMIARKCQIKVKPKGKRQRLHTDMTLQKYTIKNSR